MRKSAVDHHKTHLSLGGRPGVPAAACWCQRSPRVPGTAAARAGRSAAGLAFAAVRPGFCTACIVEAAVAEASGGPAAAGTGTALAVGRDGRTRVGGRHAGPPGGTARQCGGGPRPMTYRHPRREWRNGQMEHFSRIAARSRKGVRRGAAITPRECANAQDLLLTTLSNEPCVQSSIFGFVMT